MTSMSTCENLCNPNAINVCFAGEFHEGMCQNEFALLMADCSVNMYTIALSTAKDMIYHNLSTKYTSNKNSFRLLLFMIPYFCMRKLRSPSV